MLRQIIAAEAIAVAVMAGPVPWPPRGGLRGEALPASAENLAAAHVIRSAISDDRGGIVQRQDLWNLRRRRSKVCIAQLHCIAEQLVVELVDLEEFAKLLFGEQAAAVAVAAALAAAPKLTEADTTLSPKERRCTRVLGESIESSPIPTCSTQGINKYIIYGLFLPW